MRMGVNEVRNVEKKASNVRYSENICSAENAPVKKVIRTSDENSLKAC